MSASDRATTSGCSSARWRTRPVTLTTSPTTRLETNSTLSSGSRTMPDAVPSWRWRRGPSAPSRRPPTRTIRSVWSASSAKVAASGESAASTPERRPPPPAAPSSAPSPPAPPPASPSPSPLSSPPTAAPRRMSAFDRGTTAKRWSVAAGWARRTISDDRRRPALRKRIGWDAAAGQTSDGQGPAGAERRFRTPRVAVARDVLDPDDDGHEAGFVRLRRSTPQDGRLHVMPLLHARRGAGLELRRVVPRGDLAPNLDPSPDRRDRAVGRQADK